MKEEVQNTADNNQLFNNTRREIGNKNKQTENTECIHDLFYQELRVIAEDSAREE
jgi:hypothetical protein